MTKSKIRDRFNRGERSPQKFTSPSRTQQQFKDEANINHIVERYTRTGLLPSSKLTPVYADLSSVDFQAMQNKIIDAQQGFARLPAKVRKQFDNDPYQLLRFMEDPANAEEAKRLGLLIEDPDAPPKVVQEDLVKQSEEAKK